MGYIWNYGPNTLGLFSGFGNRDLAGIKIKSWQVNILDIIVSFICLIALMSHYHRCTPLL